MIPHTNTAQHIFAGCDLSLALGLEWEKLTLLFSFLDLMLYYYYTVMHRHIRRNGNVTSQQ